MSSHTEQKKKKKIKRKSVAEKQEMRKVIIKPTSNVGYLGNDAKTEVIELPASYRVDIKICELSADIAKLALLIVITCLQHEMDFSEIAQELKTCFDASCPVGPWQTIVGEAFYSIATHRKGYYLFFCVNKVKVIVYKCRDGD